MSLLLGKKCRILNNVKILAAILKTMSYIEETEQGGFIAG